MLYMYIATANMVHPTVIHLDNFMMVNDVMKYTVRVHKHLSCLLVY